MGTPCIHGRTSYRYKEYLQRSRTDSYRGYEKQAYGYFGLLGIGNALAPISSPLALSEITYLYEGTQTQAIYLTGCSYI